jgi:hypothetical protein
LLEPIEELLNQVTRPIEVLVVVAWLFATALGRDHDIFASGAQRVDHPLLGILGFVGSDCGRWRIEQQGVCAFQIMGLP